MTVDGEKAKTWLFPSNVSIVVLITCMLEEKKFNNQSGKGIEII